MVTHDTSWRQNCQTYDAETPSIADSRNDKENRREAQVNYRAKTVSVYCVQFRCRVGLTWLRYMQL